MACDLLYLLEGPGLEKLCILYLDLAVTAPLIYDNEGVFPWTKCWCNSLILKFSYKKVFITERSISTSRD